MAKALNSTLNALKNSSNVDLHTDSQYLRRGVTEWMPGWKRNGWKTAARKPVKNRDLWEQLDSLIAQHRVHWHWVKAHVGIAGNERADQLANEAIDAMLPTEISSE